MFYFGAKISCPAGGICSSEVLESCGGIGDRIQNDNEVIRSYGVVVGVWTVICGQTKGHSVSVVIVIYHIRSLCIVRWVRANSEGFVTNSEKSVTLSEKILFLFRFGKIFVSDGFMSVYDKNRLIMRFKDVLL